MFKKYLPVILPTTQKGKGLLCYSHIHKQTGIVTHTTQEQVKLVHTFVHTDAFSVFEEGSEYRHIYILDCDSIGHNPVLTDSQKLEYYPILHKKIYYYIDSDRGLHTIVATTDKTLGLPLISDADALVICRNRLDDLYLDTEEIRYDYNDEQTFDDIKVAYRSDKVIVTDGFVKLKFTKLYNQEEMGDIARKYAYHIDCNKGISNDEKTFDEWFKVNHENKYLFILDTNPIGFKKGEWMFNEPDNSEILYQFDYSLEQYSIGNKVLAHLPINGSPELSKVLLLPELDEPYGKELKTRYASQIDDMSNFAISGIEGLVN